jgi:hypothetical protein
MKRDKSSWAPPLTRAAAAEARLPPVTAEQLEQRYAAMKAAFGIFKGKDVFPEDGLEYQIEVRAEWD